MHLSVPDLMDLLKERREYFSERNSRYNHLIDVYHGKLKKLYPLEFAPDEEPKVANFIKLAWDSYASMVGKVPDKRVRPSGLSERAQTKAGKIERIAYAYDESSRIKVLQRETAFYLVGLGSCVRGVLPDFRARMPRFVRSDPRNAYPSWSTEALYAQRADEQVTDARNPDNRDYRSSRGSASDAFYGGGLEDIVVEYMASVASLKSQFPDRAAALGPDTRANLRKLVPVVQYTDREAWQTMVLGPEGPVNVASADHGLGFCPWRCTQTFAPDQVGGISQFEENIGMLLAFTRMLSQKLTFNDLSVWPKTWVKGEVGSMRIGPHEMIRLDESGAIGQLPPPTEFQADRDLSLLDRLIRVMNREGEPMRGEVVGGPITGRGLEELSRGVNSTVVSYWDLLCPDDEALYSYALALDEHFWPDERKTVYGRKNGEEFEAEYTPSKDIAGHHHGVSVDYGFGVGGFEGFLQSLQAMGAGVMSKQTVMEQMPGVKSVSQERRKIEIEQLDEGIFAAFQGGDVERAKYLALVKAEVSKGTPLDEAIVKVPTPAPPQAVAEAMGGGGMAGLMPPGAEALAGPETDAASLQSGGTPPSLQGLLQSLGG